MTSEQELNLSDFECVSMDVSKREKGHADWLESFIDDKFSVHDFLPNYACSTIHRFASMLFEATAPVGVLRCARTSKSWLALGNRCKRFPDAVEEFGNSRMGDFLFIAEPKPTLRNNVLQHDLLERFAAIFGGVRETFPHFGGTYFNQFAYELIPEMLTSRIWHQEEWAGSRVFATRKHYLILSKRGRVGYLPFDMEQEIRDCSESFESFIFEWLSQVLDERSSLPLLEDISKPFDDYTKLFENLGIKAKALLNENDSDEESIEYKNLIERIDVLKKGMK